MQAVETTDALRPRLVCPHCWGLFPPEQVLWISEHADLVGDPLLGAEQPQRFLPSRFNIDGNAIDARGMVCRSLACPKCHLDIPRASLELETLLLSILGAAASGKSFLLATMTHQLRRVLPQHFAIDFSDVDPASNRILSENEEFLFFNQEPDRLVPLGNLIRKTELEGELYETISLGNQTVTYPHPFLFSLQMRPSHLLAKNSAALARLLCLYDNAGEHFLPGKDTVATPVTRHLAHSSALLFVFDPTQEHQFHTAMKAGNPGSGTGTKVRLTRQRIILLEAAARIRRHTGLAEADKHPRPLIVVLTKYDQWSHMLPDDDPTEPWKVAPGLSQAALDIERIEKASGNLRELLLEHCREVVSAAEGFAQSVTYIATSALGPKTQVDPETGLIAIRPQEIQPRWVTVPLLYTMVRILPGLLAKLRRKPPRPSTSTFEGKKLFESLP